MIQRYQVELTEDEAKDRIEHPKNLVNLLIEHRRMSNAGGRPLGSKNIPEAMREIIGISAKVSGSAETSRAFGVSVEEGQNLKHNRIGTPEFMDKVNEGADRIKGTLKDKALEVAMTAAGLMTEEKLEGVKARDLAAITKDMSAVHRNLTDDPGRLGSQVNFVIYAPRVKEANEFGDVIEVESEPLK